MTKKVNLMNIIIVHWGIFKKKSVPVQALEQSYQNVV